MATSLKSLAQIIADCAKVISRVSTVETNMVKKTDFGTNFDTQKKILMGFSISGNKLYYKPSESGTATRLADYSEIPTQAQIEGWIDAKGYLTSTDIADFKNETQIRSIITGYNYLTASSIANFKTEAQIKSLIEGYGYATTSQLSGYLTSSDISGFKTEAQIKSIIEGYGYLASADLSGYATEAFVTGKGYLTESGVNTLLGTKGYLTAANLSGYVKTSDLSTYLTSADIADFVTESEVNTLLGTKGYLTSSSLTGYAKTADLNLKGLSHEDAPSNWATLKLLTVSNGVLYYNGTAISNPTTGSEFTNEAILASIFSTNATTGIANGLQLWHKKSDGTFSRLAYASEITGMALESVPSNWEDLKKLSVSDGVLYYNNVAIAGGTSGDTPTFANEGILAALYTSNSGTQTNGTQLWHKKSDNTYARLVYASEIANFLTESGVNTLLSTKGYLTSSDIAGFKTEAQIKSIIESYSYLTSSAISGFKTESQIKSIIEEYDYLTASSIADFKTEAQIRSIIEGYSYLTSTALTNYATQNYVTGLGYLTESDVNTLLSTKGYLTSASLADYATQTYVTGLGYMTESEINTLLGTKGYLTSSSLEGYVQSSSLGGMAYIDVPSNFTSTNWSTVWSSTHSHAAGVLANVSKPDWWDNAGTNLAKAHTHASGVLADVAKPTWWDNAGTNLGKAHSHASGVLADVTKPTNWDTIFGQQYFLTAAAGAMAYLGKPTWWDSMTETVIANSHTHASGVLADVTKPDWWDNVSAAITASSHSNRAVLDLLTAETVDSTTTLKYNSKALAYVEQLHSHGNLSVLNALAHDNTTGNLTYNSNQIGYTNIVSLLSAGSLGEFVAVSKVSSLPTTSTESDLIVHLTSPSSFAGTTIPRGIVQWRFRDDFYTIRTVSSIPTSSVSGMPYELVYCSANQKIYYHASDGSWEVQDSKYVRTSTTANLEANKQNYASGDYVIRCDGINWHINGYSWTSKTNTPVYVHDTDDSYEQVSKKIVNDSSTEFVAEKIDNALQYYIYRGSYNATEAAISRDITVLFKYSDKLQDPKFVEYLSRLTFRGEISEEALLKAGPLRSAMVAGVEVTPSGGSTTVYTYVCKAVTSGYTTTGYTWIKPGTFTVNRGTKYHERTDTNGKVSRYIPMTAEWNDHDGQHYGVYMFKMLDITNAVNDLAPGITPYNYVIETYGYDDYDLDKKVVSFNCYGCYYTNGNTVYCFNGDDFVEVTKHSTNIPTDLSSPKLISVNDCGLTYRILIAEKGAFHSTADDQPYDRRGYEDEVAFVVLSTTNDLTVTGTSESTASAKLSKIPYFSSDVPRYGRNYWKATDTGKYFALVENPIDTTNVGSSYQWMEIDFSTPGVGFSYPDIFTTLYSENSSGGLSFANFNGDVYSRSLVGTTGKYYELVLNQSSCSALKVTKWIPYVNHNVVQAETFDPFTRDSVTNVPIISRRPVDFSILEDDDVFAREKVLFDGVITDASLKFANTESPSLLISSEEFEDSWFSNYEGDDVYGKDNLTTGKYKLDLNRIIVKYRMEFYPGNPSDEMMKHITPIVEYDPTVLYKVPNYASASGTTGGNTTATSWIPSQIKSVNTVFTDSSFTGIGIKILWPAAWLTAVCPSFGLVEDTTAATNFKLRSLEWLSTKFPDTRVRIVATVFSIKGAKTPCRDYNGYGSDRRLAWEFA